MKIVSLADAATALAARYPNAGIVDSISAEAGTLFSIDAAAVKGFAAVSGPLQWVKASDHFYQAGELIQSGDFVQVQVEDAERLRHAGRAAFASDAEVTAAQTGKAKA